MNKKIITIILFFLVIIIWGIAIKRFAMNIKNSKNIAENAQKKNYNFPDTNLLKKLKIINLSIDVTKLTDPFAENLYGKLHTTVNQKRRNTRIEITRPPYLLQGIVWDRDNPKAILIKIYNINNKSNLHKIGDTIIVRAGDKIDFGKVELIREDYVIIIIYNTKFKLWGNKWLKIK